MSKLFFVVFCVSSFLCSPFHRLISAAQIFPKQNSMRKITIASSVGRTALEKKWSTDAGTNVLLTTSTSLVWIY
uniref:U3-Theriditoxin-Lha1a_1 n=1 Tax=Latrodectus hasselti TaxID=256736 RepID=A0A482Z8D4_LATHA